MIMIMPRFLFGPILRIARFSTKVSGPVSGLDNQLPIVALVGRPNVGKSALFNRLIRRKDAMVKNTPESHVTRDYRCGIARLGDLRFTVVDTSGLEPMMTPESIQKRATKITGSLMRQVDLALLMIDGREVVTFADEDVAQWLKDTLPKRSKTLLVANKCEALSSEVTPMQSRIRDNLMESYRLGFGAPIAISAETGDGMIDLCEALLPILDTTDEYDSIKEEEPIKVAIMGLPNVGKSTLMNFLVQYERSLAGPEVGLTRDPVSESLSIHGRKLQLVDTAGWTKFFAYEKFKDVDEKLAKEAYYAARKILKTSHVVVVMLDASNAQQHDIMLFRRELQLASEVLNEKRVLILALNKIDKLTEEQQKKIKEDVIESLANRFYEVDQVACIPLSAKTGDGVDSLVPEIINKANKWSSRMKTSALNDWFGEVSAVQRLAQFSSSGMKRVKFLSQTKTRPPTFCIRVSGRTPFTNVEKRTFLNALRKSFDFQGVPLRLDVKYGTSWDESKRAMNLNQTTPRTSRALNH